MTCQARAPRCIHASSIRLWRALCRRRIILSGDLEGLKHIGLRPIRKIKLFNGPIETKLVHIPLYKGSKKIKGNKIG